MTETIAQTIVALAVMPTMLYLTFLKKLVNSFQQDPSWSWWMFFSSSSTLQKNIFLSLENLFLIRCIDIQWQCKGRFTNYVDKILAFVTTYPSELTFFLPCLANVVCELPPPNSTFWHQHSFAISNALLHCGWLKNEKDFFKYSQKQYFN